ncbi:MAG: DUF222 domain-containing protein [Gammaproteobacteria bacterium]|nr:DUF222 domain-containing protein [Gammaproteobacteria bacterium]
MAAPNVWYGEPEVPEDVPQREHLERRITELAAHVHAATAQLLSLVRAYDELDGWAGTGAKSCAHWLNWSCGISLGVAREKVRVAHALGGLPLISKCFDHGELSYSQVRALTRVAKPENEELLLHWAQRSTAAQLERLVSVIRRCGGDVNASVQSGNPADWAVPDRRLDTWYDDDGFLNLRARLPGDEGAVFLKALEIAREQLWRQAKAASPETAATDPVARWENSRCEDTLLPTEATEVIESDEWLDAKAPDQHDALNKLNDPNENDSINVSAEFPYELAEAPLPEAPALRAMALGVLARSFIGGQAQAQSKLHPKAESKTQTEPVIPRPLGEHFQVQVHLDLRQLRPEHKEPLPAHAGHTHDCPLSEKTLKRLSCEASRVAIIHGEQGEILSVGRRSRGIPPALRRALRARDQGCRFPGCSEHRHVEAHHVEHWAQGGETALSNLVELCHHHHRLVHEGGFGIRAKADGEVVFIDPKGEEIAASRPRPSLPADPVRSLRHRQRHLGIDWRSCRSGWTGEPLNVNDAIAALESRGWLRSAN